LILIRRVVRVAKRSKVTSIYSDRQSAYAKRLGLASAYTPQMIVDGTSEFVGNDAALADKVQIFPFNRGSPRRAPSARQVPLNLRYARLQGAICGRPPTISEG